MFLTKSLFGGFIVLSDKLLKEGDSRFSCLSGLGGAPCVGGGGAGGKLSGPGWAYKLTWAVSVSASGARSAGRLLVGCKQGLCVS